MNGSSAQLTNYKHSRPSVGLAIESSTRSVPCLTDLRPLELCFALPPAYAPPFESLYGMYARQQPRRLAPQDHRAPSPGVLSPSPWPIGSRSTQYTKSLVVSVKTLRTRVPTQDCRLSTRHSRTRGSGLKTQGSRLRPSTQKQGISKQPHTTHQNHTGGEHRLLLPSCCCFCCCWCSCPSSLLGLGTQWSPKCSCPSHPMYCQGTRLRGAAQTVQQGYDGPLPHGIRGYLEPLCATF